MTIIADVMNKKISLHGLGFIQVQLDESRRLHVWHPELPRRACIDHSSIHDHRFDFTSLVITGELDNVVFMESASDTGLYQTYLHEGARSPNGGRPWEPDGRIDLRPIGTQHVKEGQVYRMPAYKYHLSIPGIGGRVATVMTKTAEYPQGAHSTCLVGVEPDRDFNRFQLTEDQLWEVVMDVVCITPTGAFQ